MSDAPLKTNRCSISQGYQFDYLQKIAAQLGINDTGQAVSVIVLDHIRHIGLEGLNNNQTAEPSNPCSVGDEAENLLEGFLPVN